MARELSETQAGDTIEVDGQTFDIGPDVFLVTEEDGTERLVHKNAVESESWQ